MQCGFCINGVIMTAKALLDRTPNPTDAQIASPWRQCCAAAPPISASSRPSAIRAVECAAEDGMNRRDFLKQSGALVVTFSAAGVIAELGLMPDVAAQGINGTPGTELDSWIAIGADGRVTAFTGKCEFGQGLFTAQTQLIAEELSVPIRPRDAHPVRHAAHTRSRHDDQAHSRIRPTSTRPTWRSPARRRASVDRARLETARVPADR
jgi:hypothetical protein